jgi:hypothetical protein
MRLPGEDEGLPVHDRRILLGGVLGLRVGAAMATVDGGHGVRRAGGSLQTAAPLSSEVSPGTAALL